MAKPNFIPDSDWKLVTSVCSRYNVDPYFIAAIGWHETHWGDLGAGKIGWILGYGYFTGSTVKEKYKGLENQLKGACSMIRDHLKTPITLENVTDFAVNHYKPSAPRSWASSVFSIYTSIKSDYSLPQTDTEVKDINDKVQGLSRTVEYIESKEIPGLKLKIDTLSLVVEFIKQFFIKLGKELDRG